VIEKRLKTRIVLSPVYDPCYNLALEEYLLDHVRENEVILFLWQNKNTVVIGKHQNAWKECRWDVLKQDGGTLVRRLSGGGAVFHDLGNLNFTFVQDRRLYDLERQLGVILQAVRAFSLDARFSGRNDLVINGKKFSGNAFYFQKTAALHHGTLLLDTDFSKLGKYLQISQEKISSKGIDSVQSRVINLSHLNRAITVQTMKEQLGESFARVYLSDSQVEVINPRDLAIKNLHQKYVSWEWTFGKTPNFDISLEERFPWGGIEIGFKLKNGVIEEALVFSDAMDENLISNIARALEGAPFQKTDIINRLDILSSGRNNKLMIEDIKKWLTKKSI